jgi:hypothetical protein
MELEARRFARKILITHAALLIVLLVIMGIAVRVLYGGARVRAIEQAKQNQEILALQTALAIENYYESVTGVLNLLQPSEGKTNERPIDSINAATWMSIRDKSNLLMIINVRDQMGVVRVIGAVDGAPDIKSVTDAAHDWLARRQLARDQPVPSHPGRRHAPRGRPAARVAGDVDGRGGSRLGAGARRARQRE